MSSDEEFSLVVERPQMSMETLEGIQTEITNYKKKYEQLIQEQQELSACKNDRQEMTEKFKQRSAKMTQNLKDDQKSCRDQIEKEKAKLKLMQQQENELMQEIQKVEETLKEEAAKNHHLKQQTDIFTTVPERNVVFTGATGDGGNAQKFEMKPRIVYPMDGGTALVTFEEDDVARKILEVGKHQVDLGAECSISVEARPVQLMMPREVEIDSEVSPQHILISNLPDMETETLLNKLEIHFSKGKHGGGEVDSCEMLPDSRTVVLSFVETHVSRGLTRTEFHEVKLDRLRRVRVTPFLNGRITNLKTKMATCPRTVLLTGIPAIMERETLQDLLEIHFQKSSNGGGEIEAFLYNPAGQHASALFEGIATETAAE